MTKKLGNIENEDFTEKIQAELIKRGSRALEEARKAVLDEEIECKKAMEALNYFMTTYWQDLARPTLLSMCCEAVGGDPDKVIPFAIPLILISGALDIHDDIIDQTKVKNDLLTVYGKYGYRIALLTADALLFKGFHLLQTACVQIPKRKAKIIMDAVTTMFYQVGDAETLELALRKKKKISPDEYIHIIKKKAADVEAHTFIGAVVGGGKQEEQKSLREYGRCLGMLFIIIDDIADMFNPHEISHRLKKEHPPLPVVYSLSKDYKKTDTYIKKIKSIRGQLSLKALKDFLDIVYQTGAFFETQRIIEDIAFNARMSIDNIRMLNNQLQMLLEALLYEAKKFYNYLHHAKVL